MKTYEIGVLPESEWFFFSPAEDTRQMFYYHTMCGHFYCNRDYYIKRDTYPPLLLVYVKAGTFCLELSGKQYEVNAGQIAFFDCQQPHYYHAKDALEFYYVHLDGPQAHELCRYINRTSGLVIDGPNNGAVLRAMEDMMTLYQNGGSESVFETSARIYQMLMLLNNPVQSPRLKKNDDSLVRAVSYIRSHVGKRITLQELADEERTMVFYESPYRVVKCLEQFAATFGAERRVSVSRELTKKFEQTLRGTLSEVLEHFRSTEPRGEFVLVVEGRPKTGKSRTDETTEEEQE